MDVVYPRCAGLDVHKQTVVACARIAANGPLRQGVFAFATTTYGLLQPSDWLESFGVKHVAMEATGVELELELTRSGGQFLVWFSNHLGCFVGVRWVVLSGIESCLLAPFKVQR